MRHGLTSPRDYVLRQRDRNGLAVGDRLRLRLALPVEGETDNLLLWRERDGRLSRWPDDASIFNHFERVEGANFLRR